MHQKRANRTFCLQLWYTIMRRDTTDTKRRNSITSIVVPRLAAHFSFIRFAGCAAAVIWFSYNYFHSDGAHEDRQQVAQIGACIVFLEFLQDQRKPGPLGRLVNIFKLFVYFWWLHVGSRLFRTLWSTIGNAIDRQEHASFAVNALNFLILIKIWSQIDYIHQSYADVFLRFNIKAGTFITFVLSATGLHLSNGLTVSAFASNSCDLRGGLLSNWFCHSSQPKSIVLFLFSSSLVVYLLHLHHNYKRTGRGFLPKNAIINVEPSRLRAGDMVIPRQEHASY